MTDVFIRFPYVLIIQQARTEALLEPIDLLVIVVILAIGSVVAVQRPGQAVGPGCRG